MTFAEKLNKAKQGNREAYNNLCAEAADSLYTIAYLTLRTEEDAKSAVRFALGDGYTAIARINDLPHLKAWLIRELTKHIVARLKEYRILGTPVTADGGAKGEMAKLPDIERLVYSIYAVSGYSVREMSMITSLTEEVVTKKLESATKRLGASAETVKSFAADFKAPAEFRPSDNRKFGDETAEIDTSDDDGLIGEMERISEIASGNAPAPRIEKAEIKEDVAVAEQNAERSATEETHEKDAPKESVELNARTFISVITAERIKGGEFLQMLGNTRISNSAYREIETNPNLTKARLIEILEQSPLTSDDYYKLLTMVKERRELLDAREERRLKQEQAGLFTVRREKYQKKEREEPKSELSRLLEETSVADEIIGEPISREDIPEEKEEPEKPAETTETDTDTATEENTEPSTAKTDDKAAEKDNSEESDEVVVGIAPRPTRARTSKKRPSYNEGAMKLEGGGINPPTKQGFNPFGDSDKPDFSSLEEVDELESAKPKKLGRKDIIGNSVDELAKEAESAAKREKYKGKEFFFDDEEYYEGANRGKLIFCGVLAVLLIGASFGIRYMNTGSFLPNDEPPSVSDDEEQKPDIPTEITSYADIFNIISNRETRSPAFRTDYYGSGEAYRAELSTDILRSGNVSYILNDGVIRAVTLNPDAPEEKGRITVNPELKLLGYTESFGEIYVIYSNGENVTAEVYGEDLTLSYTYSQDGNFVGFRTYKNKLLLVTKLNMSENAKETDTETFMPSYSFNGEKKTIEFTSVNLVEKADYNGYTLIGAAAKDGGQATAVIGGYDTFFSYTDDSFNILIADKNKTFDISYELVGTNVNKLYEKQYKGEAFSADSVNGNLFVGYNLNDGKLIISSTDEELSFAGDGEMPVGVTFTGSKAYIITNHAEKGNVLYGFNTIGKLSADETASAEAVYTDRLVPVGDKLIGLKATAGSDGSREGLKLSVYTYDGGLKETAYADISVDEKTAEKYIKYLSGDAEANNGYLAISEDGKRIAVGTVYFDGVSEIERIILFGYEGGKLTELGDLLLFDVKSDYRVLTINGDTLYIVTEDRIITTDTEECKPTGYYGGESGENSGNEVE